ncbi:unnamed protein product, partial [Rotaria socialis]
QPNLIPELQILKQGIREACRGWAQTIKQQPNKKPNNQILPRKPDARRWSRFDVGSL